MKTYSIGEVSKIFDVSIQAIRLYQRQGLITPIVNPENGYRTFDDTSLNQLWRVKVLQSAGFELKEIKYFDEHDINEKLKLLEEKKALLELNITKQQYVCDFLGRQLENIALLDQAAKITIKSYPRRYGIAFKSPKNGTIGDFIVTLNTVKGKLGMNQEVVYTPTRRTKIVGDDVQLNDFMAMKLDQEISEDYIEGGQFLTHLAKGRETKAIYQEIFDYAKENDITLRGDAVELLKVNSSLIEDAAYQLREIQVAVK